MRGYGKRKHQDKITYVVAKSLHDTMGDAVKLFRDGQRVWYDNVIDDAEAPPGYVPKWERETSP